MAYAPPVPPPLHPRTTLPPSLGGSYLDTNGDGKVSRAEWEAGVRLLNERLPLERRLPEAGTLFEKMDLDGSGELELDEFADAFRRAA